jgi:hypothetical protein
MLLQLPLLLVEEFTHGLQLSFPPDACLSSDFPNMGYVHVLHCHLCLHCGDRDDEVHY